ncbi:hypothetical protein D9M71_831160 [compost metagenome]
MPDDARLRIMSNCGNITFELIVDADDLFDSHLDISHLLKADMESHSDWVWLFR